MLLLSYGTVEGTIARFPKDELRMAHYKIAQYRGMTIYQSSSFAIIVFNTMPSEAFVRVVLFHKVNP